MAFSDVTTGKKTGFGSVGGGTTTTASTKPDLNSLEGLTLVARGAGLGPQVDEITAQPNLSVLQRLGAGLGAFNPAEAALESRFESLPEFLSQYGKSIGRGFASAVTGREFQPGRRYFKDVAEDAGIENKILKNGLGFIGDVLLDPTTYFGGAIARGAVKGVSAVSKLGLRGIGAVSPATEGLIKTGFQTAKDGFGKAFKYGYGTSKGIPEKSLEIQSKLASAKEGIVASNLSRLGTGTLSKSQQEELVQKLMSGKRTEFAAKQAGETNFVKKSFEKENEQLLEEYSIRKALLEDNPVKPLAKYANKKTGELPEALGNGKNKGIFSQKGDVLASNQGFAYAEDARNAYPQYLKDVQVVKDLKKEIVESRKMFKDEQALNEFLAKDEAAKLAAKNLGRQAAQSTDPLVQETIDQQAVRSKKFAAQAGIKDPFEIYFPGLKNDSVKNFVEGTKKLRVGSEGYLKEFRDLITDEQLVKNPAEAFAKREFEIAKDNIVRSELNGIVRQYGKPLTAFNSADDALRAGFKEVREKGAFGKPIGYLKDVDKKFLDELITPEFTTIDMIAKATGFDALTSLFKRSVTGLFPSFHVRNYVSGMLQNYEVVGAQALNPKVISAGQKMAWRLAQNDKSLFQGALGKEMKAFANRFGTSSSYIADIADATKGSGNIPGKILGKESLKTTLKTGGLGQQAIPFRAARAVGNFIETQQKATAFLAARTQGKSVEEALQLATRAGFDYRAVTGFESKILRRLIPFYTFTRKNIELQLATLGENPQRINQIMAAFKNLGDSPTEEERKGLPSYITEGFPIKTGTSADGKPEYAYSFGTPIEQFAQLFGTSDKDFLTRQLTTLNNIIKVPLERSVGKAFFENRALDTVIDAKNYKDMPDFVKDFLQLKEVHSKDFKTGADKVSYNANPKRLQLLKALPTSRGVSYLATIFNKDLSPTTRLIYGISGVKPTAVDLETTAYFKEKAQQDALEALLKRSGIIKQFETNYIPKESGKTSGFGSK